MHLYCTRTANALQCSSARRNKLSLSFGRFIASEFKFQFTVLFFRKLQFISAFSALTLLIGRQEGHPAGKKTEWWGTGMVICLEQGADLHMAQLMPLPLTESCFSKIQIGFTFLVPAHPGGPGKTAVKRVCVCVCVCVLQLIYHRVTASASAAAADFLRPR